MLHNGNLHQHHLRRNNDELLGSYHVDSKLSGHSLFLNRQLLHFVVAEMASQADFRDRQFLAVIGDEASN